jgi:hypothetical protein
VVTEAWLDDPSFLHEIEPEALLDKRSSLSFLHRLAKQLKAGREQVRGMWLALNGLMQRHPNAIPIIARGGAYSPSAGEGTVGMLGVFRDAGLSPLEAAELLHILSACVVGFGFATLWGRQAAAAQEAAAVAGEPAPAPPDLGDLNEYVAAIARWDPAQFSTALDIVLGAYGDGAGS